MPEVSNRKTTAWSYNRQPDGKDEWLTPLWMIQSLGEFDLDPCAPIRRPWDTAKKHFTISDNGLLKPWTGRVWCNPPYDRKTLKHWVGRCVEHGNCILLVFSRTETEFFQMIWDNADAVLFPFGRITFHHVNGEEANWTGGAGSALVAFGKSNVEALKNSKVIGKMIYL